MCDAEVLQKVLQGAASKYFLPKLAPKFMLKSLSLSLDSLSLCFQLKRNLV
jgi:hypothetical protein